MWLRIVLFGILIYLVIRMFNQFFSGLKTKDEPGIKDADNKSGRKVSKDVGEYVDYEEMDD